MTSSSSPLQCNPHNGEFQAPSPEFRSPLLRELQRLLFFAALGFASALPPKFQREGLKFESERVRVLDCHDGDTCRVQGAGGLTRTVRFIGIDAPELAQQFGAEAGQHLRQELVGKTLWLESQGQDFYRRYLGLLWFENAAARIAENSINAELVRQGFAFAYRSREGFLNWALKAEKEAKKNENGLWALRIIPEEPKAFRSKTKLNRSRRELRQRHVP